VLQTVAGSAHSPTLRVRGLEGVLTEAAPSVEGSRPPQPSRPRPQESGPSPVPLQQNSLSGYVGPVPAPGGVWRGRRYPASLEREYAGSAQLAAAGAPRLSREAQDRRADLRPPCRAPVQVSSHIIERRGGGRNAGQTAGEASRRPNAREKQTLRERRPGWMEGAQSCASH
jgi:hypothetical protein